MDHEKNRKTIALVATEAGIIALSGLAVIVGVQTLLDPEASVVMGASLVAIGAVLGPASAYATIRLLSRLVN